MPKLFCKEYNIEIDSPVDRVSQIELELFCYRIGHPPERGGLGRAGHFRKIAEMLFGPKSACPFTWNPWAERMTEVFHQHPITGKEYPHCAASGCTNSNKSNFTGLYGLINWLAFPIDTFVFITSTSIPDSKHRVWKSVRKMFESLQGLPGNLVDSKAKIETCNEDGKPTDAAGIFIIAGSPAKAREGVGKLIGRKNARVFVLADELPELSPAILDASFSNLISNPLFQFVGLGNFKSRYDPFGEFIEPKDGWDSISVESEEWECKHHGAYCIRFDGLKSPNIVAGKDLYPFLYGSKQLKEHRASYGENSAPFMRMCRSFETGIGDDNTIYSESDFRMAKAYDKTIWDQGFVKIAAADPAFTNGGDRFVLMFGKVGRSKDGVMTLQFDSYKILREDVSKIDQRKRSFQMADQIIEACTIEGIDSRNFAMDTTAAGGPLADVIDEVWSEATKSNQRIYRVDFSGAPTDRIATRDGKAANVAYDRRVTEIWFVGTEFLKGGQIKGLLPEMSREAKARKYETVKGVEGLKMKAETKKDMKERLMFSPDIAEAGFVMIDLARERHKFVPAGIPGGTPRPSSSFKALAKQVNRVYTSPAYA